MLTLIIVFFVLLIAGIPKNRWNNMYSKQITRNTSFTSSEDAGLAQWDDFSLTNTPDIIKKGVTDISKYYI
jgi:hypothetical protein